MLKTCCIIRRTLICNAMPNRLTTKAMKFNQPYILLNKCTKIIDQK